MTLAVGQKACMPALFGVARFGATRFGCMTGRAFISIGGIWFPDAPRDHAWEPGVLYDSVRIGDLLNERPNTCTLTTWAIKPALGARVRVALGSINNLTSLFRGTVIDVQQTQGGLPQNVYFHVSCIDDTWKLNALKVSEQYRSLSASTIVLNLLAKYAPWVTTRWVVPGLPIIDEITFTNEDVTDCLKRIAARVGAYHYLDYLDGLHFFINEPEQSPLPLTPDHPSMRNLTRRADLSQIVTRVLVEGGGVNALTDVPAGESVLPVDDDSWYPSNGVVVCGPQRITYGRIEGASGLGSLVGPGITPGSAPNLALVTGAGLTPDATYQYAYSHATAAGETRPSPIGTIKTTAANRRADNPTEQTFASYMGSPPTDLVIGQPYQYIYTYKHKTNGGETLWGPPSPAVVPMPGYQYIDVQPPVPAQKDLLDGNWRIQIYRSSTGANFSFVGTIDLPSYWANQPPGWHLTWRDAGQSNSFPYVPPGPYPDYPLNSALLPTGNRVKLSGIAIGPAGVTSRKLYRTAAGGTQLKYLAALVNNTGTEWEDAAADATLGANAPTGDTSGLTQPTGQVNPGSGAIVVASTAFASATGGYAVIGNGAQVIRYTGIFGNQLIGIPLTGFGAITATVVYNSTITAAPCLAGIPAAGLAGAIRYAIKKGDPVNLIALVDDVAAQTALAALIGGTGIVEDYAQDRRLSFQEATARASALLRQRSAPLVTLTWDSRDVSTHSGGTIVADLPPPTDIHETLKIQTVTIDSLSPHGEYKPTYHAMASSERFTLDDLLRQARLEDRHPKVQQ